MVKALLFFLADGQIKEELFFSTKLVHNRENMGEKNQFCA
jgi:hypothetical protein